MNITRAVTVAALAALAGCATVSHPAPDTLIAYRGETKNAPANTLRAFEQAVEYGFGFECDLRLTPDGKVCAFNDGTAQESKDPVSTRIEDILSLARPGRKIHLALRSGPEIVPAVRDALAAQSRANPNTAVLASAGKEVCRAAKDQLPGYGVLWIVDAADATAEQIVDGAREAGADGVVVKFDGDRLTEEFVAEVKRAGLSFHVWGVNDLSYALRSFAVGADTVATDSAKTLYDEYCIVFAPEMDRRDEFSDRMLDGGAPFQTIR